MFSRQCLYCVGSEAGELTPHSLGELVHGEGVNEVIHFDFLHTGAGRPLGKAGVGEWRASNVSSSLRTSAAPCGYSRRRHVRWR